MSRPNDYYQTIVMALEQLTSPGTLEAIYAHVSASEDAERRQTVKPYLEAVQNLTGDLATHAVDLKRSLNTPS